MQCGGLVPAAGVSTTRPVRADVDEDQGQSMPPKDPGHDPIPPKNAASSSAEILQAPMESLTPENPSISEDDLPRMPRSVQAIYLKPLKRKAQHGIPACDLQLRSYSVRNVEFFADFALRAAYYLHLPALGPVPLPRITERWTVPRSNFVNKKSQENFERITLRRLIQIHDGHPETVEIWLAFLRKHAYYGVGMKANVWEHESIGVGKTMDVSLENLKKTLEPKWAHFGRNKNLATSERVYELMNEESFRRTSDAPLSES
ncbi:MAG: hypothetical protein Q9172_003156 [Xanthocarpia lactea]